MKITVEQLATHLQKALLPVYIISGEEILLRQQAIDMIRGAAAQKEFNERKIFQIDAGFNWDNFLLEINSFSLFSNKALLELHIPDNKFSDAAKNALEIYAQNPPADKTLLLVTTKLDSKIQLTTWFKQLEKIGGVITAWPMDARQLPAWIKNRFQQAGISADAAGIQLLTDRTEGNLLATEQAIEKLLLLHGKTKVTADDIAQAISDSARFDIFDLVDCALAGNSQRTLQVLLNLQAEGIELTLVLWALARELRGLIAMRHGSPNNQALDQVMLQHKVWEKRKPLIKQALKRHSLQSLQQLLQQAGAIDYIIKGAATGNAWDELIQLSLTLAGAPVWRIANAA